MNSSNCSFSPSKIFVFIVVALKTADVVWGRCCDARLATASASLLKGLLEFEFCLCGVCLTFSSVFWGEGCVAMFCS